MRECWKNQPRGRLNGVPAPVEEIPSDDGLEPQELSKELVIAANDLGGRFAELNKLYEDRIAAEAADSARFEKLYKQHQSEQSEKVHELGDLQRRLEKSQGAGKDLQGRLLRIEEEKRDLQQQKQSMEQTHSDQLQRVQDEVMAEKHRAADAKQQHSRTVDELGRTAAQEQDRLARAHSSEIGSLDATRQREHTDLVANQKRELE